MSLHAHLGEMHELRLRAERAERALMERERADVQREIREREEKAAADKAIADAAEQSRKAHELEQHRQTAWRNAHVSEAARLASEGRSEDLAAHLMLKPEVPPSGWPAGTGPEQFSDVTVIDEPGHSGGAGR